MTTVGDRLYEMGGIPVGGGPDHIITGDVYFVNSTGGSSGAGGKKPTDTMATIDQAVGKCTANNGDVIYVMPGHAENISATTSLDIDVAGITIIGLGNGESRPILTQTGTTAYVDVAAANTTIKNILFKAGVNTGTVAMLQIQADDCLVEGNEFRNVSSTLHTNHFIETSATSNAADRLTIRGNQFYAVSADADCDSAISLPGVQDSVIIEDNIITGTFDDAGIHNVTGKVCTNLKILNNVVENTQSGDHAIELVSACTGFCVGNRLYSDAFATMLDPGSLKCIDNLGSITTDQQGVLVPNPSGINGPGSNYFTLATSFSSATWNSVASHEIATVTGLCRLRIVPECTTTLVGGANAGTGEISLGIADSTALGLAATTADNIDAGDIWGTSATTHNKGISFSNAVDIVSLADDVGYTVATSALTAGVLTFHIWWEPLEVSAGVVAGAGGAL